MHHHSHIRIYSLPHCITSVGSFQDLTLANNASHRSIKLEDCSLQSFRSKIFIGIFSCILLIGSFIGYLGVQNYLLQNQPITFSLPQEIPTTIEPRGPIELKLDQTQIFVANVSKSDVSLAYEWRIKETSSSPAMNGTEYLLLTYNNQAVFKFLTSDLEFCWLSVKVSSNNLSTKQQ